jgi:hypothetical protein
MSQSPFSPRCGLVDATTLLGRELGSALRDEGFERLRLLRPPAAQSGAPGAVDERELTAFADEPAVVEAFTVEQLQDLDLIFYAGAAPGAAAAWSVAEATTATFIDLSGGLAGAEGAVTAGWDGTSTGRLIVVAHPAAQALARLLGRLAGLGPSEACVTVFEPASERGWAGIQELEQQTLKLLSLQSTPQAIFGAQVAFNVRTGLGETATPSLDDVRSRILGDLARLRGAAAPRFPLQLLQAPLFHASLLSLYIRHERAPKPDDLMAALRAPGLCCLPGDPDATAAAESGADLQLGPPRWEPSPPGGFWMFATLDNLRRAVASAVASATACAGTRA